MWYATFLCHSNLNITEIALAIGYNDSNYFSNVFKSNIGVSPRMYRSQNSMS
ncbi:MAG: AraC family transcriptional regulator [Eubacteriales bacterium]|nr:AraC family transcriptional regulator [Eubacteriales bacterium]